jgi:hypothetical protein
MGKKSIRAMAFIQRCSRTATAGCEPVSSLELQEVLWTAVSAVMVSQVH